jgi:hypothetical protein
MRKGRFTDVQIVAILQETAAAAAMREVGRRAGGMSEKSYYRWKQHYAGCRSQALSGSRRWRTRSGG